MALNVPTLSQPEAYIGNADKIFDGTDKLIDDKSRRLLTNFMNAFAAWIGANAR
jgi:chromate reductase